MPSCVLFGIPTPIPWLVVSTRAVGVELTAPEAVRDLCDKFERRDDFAGPVSSTGKSKRVEVIMSNEQVDVFQFMAIRSPEKIETAGARQRYVRDDEYRPHDAVKDGQPSSQGKTARPCSGRTEVDLFSPNSLSPTARLVANHLFTVKRKASGAKKNAAPARGTGTDALIDAVEALLIKGLTYGTGNQAIALLPPVIRTLDLQKPMDARRGHDLLLAATRLTYVKNGTLHVLPGELEDLLTPLATKLSLAAAFLDERARDAVPESSRGEWRTKLFERAPSRLGLTASAMSLTELVFSATGAYKANFAETKRILFDVLYGLYILRRRHEINLEPVQRGLALCQALEAMALGQYFDAALNARAVPAGKAGLLNTLVVASPVLQALDFGSPDARATLHRLDLLGPQSPEDLAMRLEAAPVVHPVLARLDAGFAPFNTLKPIGVGDLKVVKQKFLGYRKGEIAHIETVLDGETKTRVHRSLDKSENTFSLSSSTDNETVKDTQSTSRFELKNEAEEVIKTDIGLTANASFSYKGNPVVDASLGAGFSFSNSRGSTEKNAKNFVNEVIAKATSRIQTRTSQARSQTRISEVEETTTHGFTNPPDKGNISGIYRWLDKVYEGQVFDFGKRMMFEFVLPEPAEFYVESRLYAAAAILDLPKFPVADVVTSGTVVAALPTSPNQIDEAMYRTLGRTHNLDAFPYPPETLSDIPLKTATLPEDIFFRKQNLYDITKPVVTESFSAKLNDVPPGYVLSGVRVTGSATFVQQLEPPRDPNVQNTLDVVIQEATVFHRTDETQVDWQDINVPGRPVTGVAAPEFNYPPLPVNFILRPDVSIKVTTKTCTTHALSFRLTLRRPASVLRSWQEAVFNEISRKTNPGSTNGSGDDLESRRMAYRETLDELKAKTLNDIIQGRADAWNELQVRRELKRQCLAIITKEFDSDASNDLLPGIGGIASRRSDVLFPAFKVTEGSQNKSGTVTEATAGFADTIDRPAPPFSMPELEAAAVRGRFVQFMEQAFEWGQLSYMFYPYFWARMPQWVQLMYREDVADPLFTEFLQSGSARVLLAVKPGFENSVLHFLATREPWSGGPSPVIGDPLYLPLYDEIRNRQDDLAGATAASKPWTFSLPTSLVYLESDEPLVMEYPWTPAP